MVNPEENSIKNQLLQDHSHENVIVEALKECQAAIDAGKSIDRAAILEKYPTIRDELSACLDGLELLQPIEKADATHPSNSSIASLGLSLSPSATLGDFRIERELGRGGMGVVYEAEQLSVGRKVALKVLPYAAMLDKRQVARFQNEARAAATLEHPNIVPVYFVGNERGVYYYAMRLVDGRNLSEVLSELRGNAKDDVPLSLITSQLVHSGVAEPESPKVSNGSSARAETVRDNAEKRSTSLATERGTQSKIYFESIARLAKQTAEALEFAHSHGIIHRDIKPANIMLDDLGDAWVTDFGLARIETDAGMTMTGDLVGTLRYMAPEQALAKRVTVDHRCDIYSLGATIYEMLTLRPLFEGADRAELLKKIAFDEPKPPSKFVKRIPADLETIVLKSLQKNPDDRYASSKELVNDLERFLSHRPIIARPPLVQERIRKWILRNQRVAAVLAMSLLVITTTALVAGLLSWNAYQGERQQRESADIAKSDAIAAKSNLQVALDAEQNARQTAIRSLELANKNLYQSHLREIQAAIREGRTRRAETLLYQYVPLPGELDHRGWEWYHLLQELEGGSRVIARFDSGFHNVIQTADGSKIAATSSTGEARVWDAQTMQLLNGMHVPYGKFMSASFSPDGSTIAITSQYSQLTLWRYSDGHSQTFNPEVTSFCWTEPNWHSDGKRLTYADRNQVHVFDTKSEYFVSIPAPAVCHTATWRPGRSEIAYGFNGKLRFVDFDSGEVLRTFKSHQHDLWSIDWMEDGARLATGSFDNHAKIIDPESGEVIRDFRHEAGVVVVALSPDESKLACGTTGQEIVIWDIETGKRVHELSGSRGWVESIHWANDASHVLAVGRDGGVRTWDLGQPNDTIDRSFRRDIHLDSGKIVYTRRDQNEIVVEDPRTRNVLARVPGNRALWHPSGDRVLIKDGNLIRHLRVETGEVKAGVTLPEQHWLAGGLSSDGRFLVTQFKGKGDIHVWDIDAGAKQGIISDPALSQGSWAEIKWSPTRSSFALIAGNRLHVWDADTMEQLVEPDEETFGGIGKNVSWSPEGDRVAAFGGEIVVVWDLNTRKEICRLEGHVHFIRDVAWSPNGLRLASGGHDQSIKIWDSTTGKELHSLNAHTARIRSLAFHPDGKRLASSDDGGTIRLWDASSGDELLTLSQDTGFRILHWIDNGGAILAVASDDQQHVEDMANRPLAIVFDAARGLEMKSNGELDSNVAARKFAEGIQLARSQRLNDSAKAFREAEGLVGIQSRQRLIRGRIYAELGHLEEAMTDLEVASSAPNSLPEAKSEYAWLLANHRDEELREPLRAERIARGLVTEWPQCGEFWTTLSMSLLRQQRWKEADAALSKADEFLILGHSKVRWMQAMCHFQMGNFEEADLAFKQGTECWEHEEGYNAALCFDTEAFRAEVESNLAEM